MISAALAAALLSTAPALADGNSGEEAVLTSQNIQMIMVVGKNKAYVNGSVGKVDETNKEAMPFIRNGIVMLPVRGTAEAMGAEVGYDGATGEITVDGNGHSLRLMTNSDTMTADGVPVVMDAAVTLSNGSSMVPALVFVEALGGKVFWNSDGIIVIGNTVLNPDNEKEFISAQTAEITGDMYWTYNHATDYIPLAEQQAQLKFDEVTPEMVKQAIEETGTIGSHASLFVTEEDLERMKQYLEDGDPVFKKLYDYTISFANNAVEYDMPDYHLDAAGLRIEDMHNFEVNSIPACALAYRLTGEKKYLDRVKGVLAAVATFEDWGAPRHFLDAGVGTSYIAIAYDLVYDQMSKSEREDIETAIMEKTLMPGLDGMNTDAFWTTQGQNWNGICHTGIRLGAYICYERDPELCAEIIAKTLNHETEYIRAFEPMGQTEEGLSYFEYGVSFIELSFEADENIMGTDFGLSDTNGLRNAGWFPLRTSGTMAGISLGDGDLLTSVPVPRLWLAWHYDDTGLGKIIFERYETQTSFDWRLLAYYDKEFYDRCMTSEETGMTQLDNQIPALDLISFRNKWSNNGNFISIHAASNAASHGHLDAGQVDIQANGVQWVMGSLGKDDYNYPGYFDATRPDYNDAKGEQTVAGRNHFYRLRAEGKTAVVVQGDGTPDIRPDQDPNGLPVIETIVSKPKGAYTIVDLTDCYNRDVQSYKRGIMMSQDRQLMTIQDEITTKSIDSTIWWLMNTPAEIEISEDGKTVLLTYQSKQMWVKLSSPSEAVFKEIEPTYLPGESFPLSTNTVNTTNKLAIELPKTQKTTITVNFVPLAIGESAPPFEVPRSRPMEKWTIEGGSLVEQTKPLLSNLTIDGVTPDNFAGEEYTYTYLSPLPLDSDTEPVIEGTANDADVTYSKDGNVTTITVSDKADANNYTKYIVTVKKMGAPSKARQLSIRKAEASAIPEANHLPEYTIDGSLEADSRWSAQGEQYLDLDLGGSYDISYFGMAVLNGDTRKEIFDVLTSEDGENWKTVYSGKSGGETADFEYFKLEESKGRYVRLLVKGCETTEWNSILEVQVFGN